MTNPFQRGAERRGRPLPVAAALGSAALHVAALLVAVVLAAGVPPTGGRPLIMPAPRRPIQVVLLPPPVPAATTGEPAGPPPQSPAPGAGVAAPPPQAPVDSGVVTRAQPASPAAVEPSVPRPVGPRYGAGTVWVTPLPRSPRELAEAMAGRPVAELADSVVEALVRAYLDSLAREPGANLAALPSWTTAIGGREYGLDGSSIVVAGIRIPAALLALIPFPVQGNYDQDVAWREAMAIRRDIYSAARRADNLEEFKRYVRELREETDRKRTFERNRRTPPPAEPPEDAPLP